MRMTKLLRSLMAGVRSNNVPRCYELALESRPVRVTPGQQTLLLPFERGPLPFVLVSAKCEAAFDPDRSRIQISSKDFALERRLYAGNAPVYYAGVVTSFRSEFFRAAVANHASEIVSEKCAGLVTLGRPALPSSACQLDREPHHLVQHATDGILTTVGPVRCAAASDIVGKRTASPGCDSDR